MSFDSKSRGFDIFYGQFYFLIAGITGIAKILFATMSVDYFYAHTCIFGLVN
jgi:hypothetical protein